MTNLTNSAEGGVSGVTVTAANSGGTSGNAFSSVFGPTGSAVCQFDNTHANSGTLSYLVSTGTSGPATYMEWSSFGSANQLYFRIYLYLTAWPSGQERRIFRALGAGNILCATLIIDTNGTVAFLGSSGQSVITTMSTIAVNQFVRIEGYVVGNASNGQVQIQLFNSPSSTVATEVKTSSSGQRTGGAITQALFGQVLQSGSGLSIASGWFDDIGVSTTGYLGPVQTSTTLTTPNIVLFAPSVNPVVVPPPPIVPNFIAGYGPQQPDMQSLWVNPLAFFQQKMVFRARQTVTATTLPSSGAVTTIIFDTIDEDPYAGWSSPSWTPPAGYNGWFQVTVTIRVTAPGHLQTVLAPYVNSPSTITGSGQMAGITLPQNDPGGAEGSFIIYLTGGQDSVTVAAAVENASANVTTSLVNGQQSSCEICWLGV